jgi:PrgI family protein
MQFSVPQFIEVEDKIFGPFTFKQFIFLVGGAGLSYFTYSVMPGRIALLAMLPVMGFSIALAFYKVNDRPFLVVLESAFYYSIHGKLFLWKHKNATEAALTQKATDDAATAAALPAELPSLSDSKLRDISWSLDINEYVDNAGKGVTKLKR